MGGYSCGHCRDKGVVQGMRGIYARQVACQECRTTCPNCDGLGHSNYGSHRELCDVCGGRTTVTRDFDEQWGDRIRGQEIEK